MNTVESLSLDSLYGIAACAADLERLGFRTTAFPQSLRRRARECVIGVRDPAGGG